MKQRYILYTLFGFLALSCAREAAPGTADPSPLTLSGALREGTKAYIGDKTEAGWPVLWENTDAIGVVSLDGTYQNARASVASLSENASWATFHTDEAKGVPDADIYVFYPYSASAVLDAGTLTYTTTVPSEQEAVPDGTSLTTRALAWAKAVRGDDGISFTLSHATAYLRLVLGHVAAPYADMQLTRVKVSAGGTTLSGKVSLGGDGSLSVVESIDQVVLSPTLPSAVDGTILWASVLPADLTGKDLTLELSFSSERLRGDATVTVEGKRLVADAVNTVAIDEIVIGATTPVTPGISDAEDLLAFGAAVAAGVSIDGYKDASGAVVLNGDIDLSGINWTSPVARVEEGLVFDGQGHRIKNWTSAGIPLFEDNYGTLRNLVIDSSCAFALDGAGNQSLLVNTNRSTGSIEGVENQASVSFSGDVKATLTFGFLARCNYGVIRSCKNTGSLTLEVASSAGNLWLGGIAGYNNTNSRYASDDKGLAIADCTNEGDLSVHIAGTARLLYMGGISAGTSSTVITSTGDPAASDRGLITGCTNAGALTYRFDACGNGNYINLGGIAGYMDGRVVDCTNTGAVSASCPTEGTVNNTRPSVGGVAGFVRYAMSGCRNSGDVSVTGMFGASGTAAGSGCCTSPTFGGVVGQIGGDTEYAAGALSDCHNTGRLTVRSYMLNTAGTLLLCGGVAGFSSVPTTGCTNKGGLDLLGKQKNLYVGGIVGRGYSTLADLTNEGRIGFDFAITEQDGNCGMQMWIGGVLGKYENGSNGNGKLSGLFNKGDVAVRNGFWQSAGSWSYFGGIYGQSGAALAAVKDCTNSGNLSNDTAFKFAMGGIAGQGNALEITGCYNTGDLSYVGTNSGVGVGGLIGQASTSATLALHDCSSRAAVTASGNANLYAGLLVGLTGATNQDWYNLTAGGTLTAPTLTEGLLIGGITNTNAAKTFKMGSAEAPLKVVSGASVDGTSYTEDGQLTLPVLAGKVSKEENVVFETGNVIITQ